MRDARLEAGRLQRMRHAPQVSSSEWFVTVRRGLWSNPEEVTKHKPQNQERFYSHRVHTLTWSFYIIVNHWKLVDFCAAYSTSVQHRRLLLGRWA